MFHVEHKIMHQATVPRGTLTWCIEFCSMFSGGVMWLSKMLVGSGDSNPHCLSTEFSQSLPPCRSWRASARLHPYAPKFFAKIQPSRCSQFHISNFFCNKVNYAGNTVVFSRDLLPLQGKLLCETNVGSSPHCLHRRCYCTILFTLIL